MLDRPTSSSSLRPSSSLLALGHHLPSVKEIVDAQIDNASQRGREVVERKVRRGPCVVISERASPTDLHCPPALRTVKSARRTTQVSETFLEEPTMRRIVQPPRRARRMRERDVCHSVLHAYAAHGAFE